MEVTKSGEVFCCHGECPGSAVFSVDKLKKYSRIKMCVNSLTLPLSSTRVKKVVMVIMILRSVS